MDMVNPPFIITPSYMHGQIQQSQVRIAAIAAAQRAARDAPIAAARQAAAMDAAREAAKRARAFSEPRNDVREAPPEALAAYAASRNRVVGASGGTMWQGRPATNIKSHYGGTYSAEEIAVEMLSQGGGRINKYLDATRQEAAKHGGSYSPGLTISEFSGRTSDYAADLARFAVNRFALATGTFQQAQNFMAGREGATSSVGTSVPKEDFLSSFLSGAREVAQGAAAQVNETIFGGFRTAGQSATRQVTSPVFVDTKYSATGGRDKDVGLSAKFLGRGVSPTFGPEPGSVTERFAFDEYGKVLRPGSAFAPATSNEGIPYNPKMGAGEYEYAGEYQYSTGEKVSRYVEKNVGSYVDFGQGGMAFRKEVEIRGGAGPGGYYETYGYKGTPATTAARSATRSYTEQQSAVMLQTETMGRGINLFDYAKSEQARAAALVVGGYAATRKIGAGTATVAEDMWGGAMKAGAEAVNSVNAMFAKVPVLAELNLSGREVGLGLEISGLQSQMEKTTKQYEESGVIRGTGEDRAFAGTQEQYADLLAIQNRVEVLQAQREGIQKQLVGGTTPGQVATKPIYEVAHAGSVFWAETIVGSPQEGTGLWGGTVKGLESPMARDVTQYIQENRQYIGAAVPPLGFDLPFVPDTPAKLSEASTALVGVPGQMLEFGGMIIPGAEIMMRSPAAVPALAVSGLAMQVTGIKEGLETRPTGFIYEQLGMLALSEVAMKGAAKASPVGGGVLEVPGFAKGSPATKYYAVYSKMPFSAEGGVPRFMAGVAKIPTRGGGQFSFNALAPSFDINIVPQSPIAIGRVNFFVPGSAEMGFVGVRPPIALKSDLSFGLGYTRTTGAGGEISTFAGSPSKKFSSLLEGGWKFGHQFPFEFERGYKPGFAAAEKFVLPRSIRTTREYGLMQDVLEAQKFLESTSAITQKRPYAYRHADVTQPAWDAFMEVLQRPEYRENVVIGGSTVAEAFVEKGKFRSLKASADVDLFVHENVMERLANDVNTAMQSRQSNILMEIDRTRATPSFSISVKGAGEPMGIVEAHTFSAFPDVLKQTKPLELAGGGSLRAVAPEYTLRSKLAGSMFSFRVTAGEEAAFSFKRLKDFPDVISLSRESVRAYPEMADVFKRLSDEYTEMVFSRGAQMDIRDIASVRFAKSEFRAEHPGMTLEDLTKEMTTDLRGYRGSVRGFGNVPFDVAARPAEATVSQFGVSFKATKDYFSQYHAFTGAPTKILRETGFKIAPSMETKEGPWSNIQHAVFDKYLIENLPPIEAEVMKATSPAVRAAYSRLYTPEQRELFGELPSKSASKKTIGEMAKVWEQYGANFRVGGSRALRAIAGEGARRESIYSSDIDTYVKNRGVLNEAYYKMLAIVKKEHPGVESVRGPGGSTHPATSRDVTKAMASITTHPKYEFFHGKPFETYSYMIERQTMKVKAVGGAMIDIIHPSLMLKRKTAGIFSTVEQAPGGKPRLTVDRPKDIPDAYALARAMSATLYKEPLVDIGGVVTGAKVRRAAALEKYSEVILDYAKSLPKAQREEAMGMFGEMRADVLKGVNRAPTATYDVLTGHGIVSPGREPAYQTVVTAAGATVVISALGPMFGVPKLAGGVAGVIFPGMRKGKHLKPGTAQLTEPELMLYRGLKEQNIPFEQSIVTTREGKLLSFEQGGQTSVSKFSEDFVAKYRAASGGYSVAALERTLKSSVQAHTHPGGGTAKKLGAGYEEFIFAPSSADVANLVRYAPEQDIIISKSGAVVMELPPEIRAMSVKERTEIAEVWRSGAEKVSMKGSAFTAKSYQEMIGKPAPGSMFEAMQLPREQRLALGREIGAGGQAGFAALASETELGVTFIRDINLETGIGRTSGFSGAAKTRGASLVKELEKGWGAESIGRTAFGRRILTREGELITARAEAPQLFEEVVRGEAYPKAYPETTTRKGLADLYTVVSTGAGMPMAMAFGRSGSFYPTAKPMYGGSARAYPTVMPRARAARREPVPYLYREAARRQGKYPVTTTSRGPYPTSTPTLYPPGAPPTTTRTPPAELPVLRPPGYYPPGSPPSTPPGWPPAPPRSPPGTPPGTPPRTPPGFPPGTPPWTFEYPSLTTMITYIPPGFERTTRKRRKRARKSQEWYIWNPVPLFESVFGYGVRPVWPGQFPLKSSELVYPRPMGKPKWVPTYFSTRPPV